ncbi:MAG: hypothetical protein A3G32_03155 [Deltaproteobacteria bacterium RIFCSPLOWO2_12_FULL_40_28]|nr:MAG: hypothetical protein A3C45_01840 [Deltaproteobacteria bacterium RIFCSPHIGHO2_02_FULL_40_28]OGQ19490.1 MAG: hypothetical protein A3E27_02020 [Deltaproteobacteria bacterium RIFCSPHIGHO2_12_FULL_40_32]OGQ39964.1 MAG: hypothetical protein A3I69_07985 [Deltaproteobacteria bacterium RIFCSPLOWO2_02_FULL_40_36]OGQ54362.1 MAG: hypothetical protein A3G32_03155 [Deltaproteobacteria bacterium RIFCSPLOWO2_12_FULL_40_28]
MNQLSTFQGPEFWPIQTIERITIGISLVLLTLGLFLWPTMDVFGGLLGGTLVALINFRFIKKTVEKILVDDGKNKSRNGLRFLVKMILLIAVVGTLLLVINVSALAFLCGFSSLVLAIFCEGVKSLFF